MSRDDGFTLAELLVVVSVIAVLSAVAVPLFLNQDARAARNALEADLVAASGMLTAARGFGYPLPPEFPAGQQTVVQGVGTLEAQQTLLVVDSPESVCVEGVVPGTDTVVSMSDTGGLVDGACAGAGEYGLAVEYPSTQFVTGSDMEVLSPVVEGASDDVTFTLTSGTLPPGVTLDPVNGDLTGPATAAWNFEATSTSMGREHGCAITSITTLKCWGANGYGQLGNETDFYIDSPTPVDVADPAGVFGVPMDDVVSVSVGGQHTCAITTATELFCWGSNSHGQLGLGDGEYDPNFPLSAHFPQLVSAGWRSVSAGPESTCGVKTDGSAYCWGSNLAGRAGAGDPGSTPVFTSPTKVLRLTGVTSLSSGFDHVCAVAAANEVWCWGGNMYDQLGTAYPNPDEVPDSFPTPTRAQRFTRPADSVSAGTFFTCATSAGNAYCWGLNNFGQVGDGIIGSNGDCIGDPVTGKCRATPVRVGALTNIVSIQAADEFACASQADGTVWCWGNGERGSLGNGSLTVEPSPQVVTGAGVNASNRLGNLSGFSGAVSTTDGRLLTWGDNSYGQLGNGGYDSTSMPAAIPDAGPTDGFPATITIRASDGARAGSTSFTLTQSSAGL